MRAVAFCGKLSPHITSNIERSSSGYCTVTEPGCFSRGGQGGASNQPGVAQKSSLFQYKNVVDYTSTRLF